MVVVAAPRRHAVKVADVVGLRQREELVPRQRERILDQAADLELPGLEIDVRLLAEIEHRPVLDLVLADRQLRHAVAVRRAAAFGRLSAELDVDGALVERDLPLDVFLAAFDEASGWSLLTNRS